MFVLTNPGSTKTIFIPNGSISGTVLQVWVQQVILGSVANNVIHHAHAQCLQSADIFGFVCCDVPILLLTKLEIKPKYLRQKQGGMKNKRETHLATSMGRLI
jgi:hypothetical protein